MKGSLKIGIAALIVLLMASAVSAADSSTIQDTNITLKILDIKEEVGNTIKINYGDTLKVKVTYPADSDSTQYLDVKDRDNNNALIERYSLGSSGVQTVSIASSEYSPATNFTLVVNTSKYGDSLNTTAKGWTIVAEIVEPVISLTLKNPSNLIAKGDNVKIEGTITTTEYTWKINGPFNTSKFYMVANNATVHGTQTAVSAGETSATVTAGDHKIEVTIPTHIILQWCDGTTGTYTFKVWNANYEDTTASIDFSIVGLSITTSVDKDELKLGETLKVFGTVNVAETNSEYDNTTIGANNVTIYVYNETGGESDNLVTRFTVNVKEDGTFEKDIDFELTWTADTTYEIKANVTTGNITAQVTPYYKDDSAYVEVDNPEVKFVMDDVTFTRGEEDIKFTGTASLSSGNPVYVKESDIDDFATAYSTATGPDGNEYVKALVGTDGSWQTEEMNIKDDASIGSYTVHVYIFNPSTGAQLDEDSIKISIVRQELDASIDKTSVAKGGKLKINGSTTVSTVFIFASEAGVFQGVTENPTDTVYTTQTADMDVPVTDDEFTKTLNVLTQDVDAGSYLIYLYAPSTSSTIRTAEDPQKVFSVTVTDAVFTDVPDIITMVRGQETKVKLTVAEGSKDDVKANFTFKGSGIKIAPSEYSSFANQLPDDDGIIELTLYPFWYKNSTQGIDRLESSYNTTPSWAMDDSTLLPVGVYSLEAEISYRDTGEDIEKVTIPVQVVAPEIDVELPAEVALGDKLKITVKTNREENYDGIYVVLGRTVNPVWQKVTTDENGTAIAEFETLGLGLGTFNIYVRDTMKTVASGYGIDDYYDWDPAMEKDDWSKDDIYMVKTVSVVQQVEVTPTPEETETPEETPTEVPTTPEETPTEVPTEVPTEEETEVPTEEETETPVEEVTTPEEGPGFEAVFAIAGLLAVAYLLRRRA
jgi:PGF-CTERM protein